MALIDIRTKAYVRAKVHFVVICANICITYFLFDNKVLKGFQSVNITFIQDSRYHFSRRSRVALHVCYRLHIISVSKHYWSGIQEFT